MGIRLSLKPVLRPLVAAGVMGAVLIALGPDLGLALYIGTGTAVYAVALVTLRGIPKDVQPHLAQFGQTLGRLRARF